MGLLSIFKRGPTTKPGPATAGDPGEPVQRARTRARQRLIGAVVLVGLGIIGFPLVFETQPRPIPVDIPIELPRKDNAPPLVMPSARSPTAPTPATDTSVDAPTTAPAEPITETREEAGRELPPAPTVATSAEAAAPPASRAAAKPLASAPVPTAPKPATASPTEGERAQALLEGKPGKPAKPAGDGRFVVQVGAFADPNAARDTRLKVEKLGLKTYTQVANVTGGSRIRVRAGPFASRAEADKAVSKARAAGLSAAVVLTL